ncbi:MAG: hypothetical protein ACREMY_04225 [bacterium]
MVEFKNCNVTRTAIHTWMVHKVIVDQSTDTRSVAATVSSRFGFVFVDVAQVVLVRVRT